MDIARQCSIGGRYVLYVLRAHHVSCQVGHKPRRNAFRQQSRDEQ